MSNTNYNKSQKIIKYGKYTEEIEDGQVKTTVIKSISVDVFYKLYIELNNVIGYRRSGVEIIDMRLPPTPIELLVHLMMKDEDHTIVFRNKDATLERLGVELNKSTSSIYSTLNKLRKAGYIQKDEDNLLILNDELRDLIKNTENHLSKHVPLTFDYLFSFCVESKE